MWSLPWADVLVGEDGRRWRTVPQERAVLVVVHTATAATRLLDVLPLWSGDHRVQTAFTCPGTSAFTTGTAEFLRSRGIEPISWDEAVRGEFDLAVAASYGGPLHELRAPLIILPHGMGYNKFQPGFRDSGIPGFRDSGIPGFRESSESAGAAAPAESPHPAESPEPAGHSGSAAPVFGLSAKTLVHDGSVVPSVAVLSHSEQRERLRRYCPEAVDAALVAGDPCFDRMLAARPLRESYRQRLGAGPHQRLVVLSSTWGEDALLARNPELVTRLARRLPLDEYRLAVALHPNTWCAHTPWQVRSWTAAWERAGVVVLPPEEGWRAALVAADLVIGDHGSVTFYGAALGVPVLLAAAPLDAVDAASPIARLLRTAPRLDPAAELRGQLDAAIRGHDPEHYAGITADTTSVPGESARILRSTVYSHLGLPEPPHPAETTAVPLPPPAQERPGSQVVHLELDEAATTATVERFPAEALREPARLPEGAILVTTTDEPVRRWLEWAEVLLHADRCADPEHWIRATLARTSAAVLAATRDSSGRWVVAGADVPSVRFTGPDDLAPIYAAFVHARLARGLAEVPGSARFLVGRREIRAELS